MKILVADDSIVSRHLLNSILTKWGYEVILASDGTQAWDVLSSPGAPPLAILDWMMPGFTGPEVCRKLRLLSTASYTYILLLTSKGLKEDVIQGLESGADDYVVKPFDQHELKVRLRAAARMLDLQAELLATREALREQATMDSLTRIWNRPSILEAFNGELARARRENKPVGVIIVDLDRFKSVNDNHGHMAGDIVLQEAARRMRHSIREYDSIGRYGGEEFLILLPGCDEQTTYAQAERLRAYLAAEPVALPTVNLALTASFGCTSAPAGFLISRDTLMQCADQALYSAKRQGRNRVEFQPSVDQSSEELADPTASPPGSVLENAVQ